MRPVKNIRAFRRAVSRLKQQGIVRQSIDARRAQPYWLSGGNRLSDLIKRYSNVASGNATVVKLTKDETAKFAAQGYRTVGKGANKRVIIPHMPDERVFVSHGYVTIKHPSGIERVQIPVPYHNLEQYLTEIQAKRKSLNKLKNTNEYFGFRFFNHRSSMYSRDIGLLIGELVKYDSVQATINTKNAKQMDEMYQNLEIIRFERPESWYNAPESAERLHYKHRNEKAIYKRRVQKLKRGPEWKKEQYRSANAERQRQYRLRLKNDPDAYAEYLERGKKRKAKWKESKS